MKKISLRTTIVLMLIIIAANSAFCQSSNEKIKKDIITIVDNEYQFSEYRMFIIGEDVMFSVESSASAPVDIISRDYFMNTYSTLSMMLILAMFDEAGFPLKNLSVQTLEDPVGDARINISFKMHSNGILLETTVDGNTNSIDMTWNQILGDN